MSAEFDYTLAFYELLESESTEEVIDGISVSVFRGGLVKAYRSLEIGQSYYSRMMETLKRMGCITVLVRGARATPSVVTLHHAPTAEEYERIRGSGLTGKLGDASLASEIAELKRRLGGIDIQEALIELQAQVTELQGEVRELREQLERNGVGNAKAAK
jgi:hypothetical protein